MQTSEAKLRAYLKRVTLDLRATRQRLLVAESGRGEPVAVVAMSCRYPGGAHSPEQLWDLLARGADAVGPAPAYRGWDPAALSGAVGVPVAPVGGFVEEAADFDADLFGISPREALGMDPQQRLLLEGAWELFERARIDVTTLHGTRTGVFVGGTAQDHAVHAMSSGDFALTGSSGSILSGRISYAFGLEGPAVTVDTACSSSLVALHLAAQSVRSGECSLAITGGVAVLSTPGAFLEFARQGGLSGSGRCRSFAAAADGTGWGEGVGLLLLERLSDARRNGHEVLAVVSGTAVNQDGASNGLTAPNGPAQQRVIRQALDNAGLSTEDVDVVEAHGTGTVLGDPIEAQAVLATYGRDRARPLLLGSLKSNIGHTQAAAGVAGVIKVIEAIRRGHVPATLHVDEPSPHVDWAAGSVRLVTDAEPWPATGRPRRAGVSSFGFSGTNAHVIIEQPPAVEEVEPPSGQLPPALSFVLSGRTPEALRARADQLVEVVRDERTDLAELSWSLATTRAALDHRAAVVATDRASVLAGVAALGRGEPHANLISGSTRGVGQVALVFPGQGAQRAGMGRELYAAFPVFAAAFDEVCSHVDRLLGRSLRDLVFEGDQETLDRTEFAQPALFALGIALSRLLAAGGVRPDAVLGHSVGEITAACVAEALSVADAARLVVTRGKAMQDLPAGGAMVALRVSEAEVTDHLGDGVDLAAVNGPESVVLSGERAALQRVVDRFAGRKADWLAVSHAFHSAGMDPALPRLAQSCAGLDAAPPTVPVVSTLTGTTASADELGSPAHWVRHARDGVRFADGVQTLADHGVTTFVEAGPDGTLTALLRATDRAGTAVLRPGHSEPATFVAALSALFTRGHSVDWAFLHTAPPKRIPLPTYPFQRDRYWLAATATDTSAEWRLLESWRPVPLGAPALTGTWALVAVPSPEVDALTEAFAAAGASTVVVDPGDLAGLGQVDSVFALDVSCETVLALAQADIDAPLWCATRNAVAVGAMVDPVRSQVWGLGRVIALEHPHRWGGLIDLPEHLDPATATRVVSVVAGDEDQVALRDGGAFGRRLVPTPPTTATPWQPRGTVLITGGTGALGGHVARWAAAHGADHLLLVGRRGATAPGADDLAAELTHLGAQVSFAACDVADRDALAAVIADVPPQHPLSAIVHAAGVARFRPVAELTADDLAADNAAKVLGAKHLDELTGDLDAFVLFSSGAAAWGSAGNAAYAAGNAYLDGLAARRHSQGLPATSVAWGTWAGGGMADGEAQDVFRRQGVRPMDPALAVRALVTEIGLGGSGAVVADVDWARFAETFTLVRRSALLSDIPAVRERRDAPGEADHELMRRLTGRTTTEQLRVLVELVRADVAAVLGHGGPAAVDSTRPFADLGFDSLTAVELRDRVSRSTGLALPATLVFDHPTAEALAAHLHGELVAADGTTPETTTTRAGEDDPVVVVGMSCRYPGGIASPDDLWELVLAGGDGITPFPDDRGWDLTVHDPDRATTGTSYVGEGGFVDGVADFDAELFGISPREALAMDPQQRLLLEATWELFERAGIAPGSLRGSSTGVFVGGTAQDHAVKAITGSTDTEGYVLTGSSGSVLSGRLAYTFGLRGPALTIDTACSSSLVALHLAAQAVRAGECALALAGGVTVMSTPGAFVEFSRQGVGSRGARCRSFAAAADGSGWGEGVGLLLVERLSDARRNSHEVLAVLRGSAVNSDGASNGLTAPNGPAQQQVIRQALESAQLTTRDVDVVEAHGTGTTLGDPIEAQALLATYGQDRAEPLLLGSVKSNLGHTQAAAGVAGVIKVIQAMRHGVVPPTLHVDEPTPHVDWTAGSVELVTAARPWPEVHRPRRAGVSSFGISGTNAHVVLEQPAAPEPVDTTVATPVALPFVVSGRTPEALRAAVARVVEFAGDSPERPVDVAWSLATTRTALDHRAALVGTDPVAAGRRVISGSGAGGRVAFLFPGQGGQRVGMGRELYAAFPVFAVAFDEVCSHVDPLLGRSLRDLVFEGDQETLNRTEFAQPALFAVGVALARLLESWGVRADVVLGHSIGEVVAACVAGALPVGDAALLATVRGRMMQSLPDSGAMAAIEASESEVLGWLVDGAELAAVNGPQAVVVSGVRDAVETVVGTARQGGRRATTLRVSHAFHSAFVDPVLGELEKICAGLAFTEPRVPVLSNLTGVLVGGAELGRPGYWAEHARKPVRFADGLRALADQDIAAVVELGPGGALTALAHDAVIERGGTAIAALRGDRGELDALMTALATLFTRGHTIDWDALFAPADPRRVILPTYPFQRRRYWLEWAPTRTTATAPRRYTEAWRSVAIAPAPTGRWVVVRSAENPLVSTVVANLAEHIDITVLSSDVFAEQIGALGPVDGVLSLVGLGEEPVAATVALAQALAGLPIPAWWITRGAVTGDGAAPPQPDQAQLWGFGRVIALERGVLGGGLIDLPDLVDALVVEQLVGVLASAEDQIAIRPTGPVARRLVPASRGTRAWRPRGTVLVTGGTGALGGHAARWAAQSGAQHLVLLSRGGHAADDLLTDIRAAGAEVTVIPCDVSDRDALAVVLAEYPPTAVIHAAGVPSSGLVAELTPENLAEATAAKIHGARHLDELTGDLDAFVLFSSGAASWGSAGNAAYAMGNAALDGIALRRRAAGQPACAIAWGPWAGGGMADADSLDRFSRRGINPLDPVTAVQVMATAALGPEPLLTVADMDWPRFAETFTAIRPSPLLSELPGVRRPEPQRAPERAVFTGPTGRDRLLDLVRAEIAAVLGYSGADAVAPDRPLLELGFDSLTAVELRTRLDAATGLSLPTSVVFDHPSPTALAEHLHGLLTESEPLPVTALSISGLYRDACAEGRYTEANALSAAAAALRPTFAHADPLVAGEPIRLASAPGAPVVIGVPAASPLAGPYEFARIARYFEGLREFWVLPLPGFVAGEPLPATLDVLVEVLGEQVLRLAGGRTFVLAGRSSGGTVAHAVAAWLEAEGSPAEALVLLDTYEPGSDAADRTQPALLRNLADREAEGGQLDDVRLTAMAGYFGLLAQWEPRALRTRTLFVAAEGIGGPDGVAATWSLPHDLVHVPGDHFSMTEEHAPRTAAAVQEWLSTNLFTTHGVLT